MAEVIGIDHIYIAVSDIAISERFYDVVMATLGFRRNTFEIDGDKHIQYYNRHFGYVLRPSRQQKSHDPYAPGLHHLCLRVKDEAQVHEAALSLKLQGVPVSDPKHYPEYAPDYVACFLSDPDGIRLEITNYRLERRQHHDEWDA